MPIRYLLLLLLSWATAAGQVHPSGRSASQAAAPKAASAAPECPWLTRGTAAVLLDGEVTLTVTTNGALQGSCVFHRQQQTAETLVLTVSGRPSPSCHRGGVPLQGIANWASECMIRQLQARRVESIVGQARDRYFEITLTFEAAQGWEARSAELRNIAEQVAGSLY